MESDRSSPSIESTLLATAQTCFKDGKYEEALTNFKEFLEISTEKSDEILFRIGDCYRMMDKHEEGLNYFTRLLDINKHELQPNNCSFAVELHIIGAFYLEQGKYNDALECLNKSMRIYETLPTTNDSSIADLYLRIGLAYVGLDMYKEVLDNCNASLDMYRLILKSNQFEYRLVCKLLEFIGLIYEIEGNFEETIKYYTESLEIMREHSPHEIAEIARVLKSIGSAHRKDGNHHEAFKSLNESLEICELLNDEDLESEVRQEIRLSITECLMKYKDAIKYAVKQQKRDSSLFFRLVRHVRNFFRRVRKSSCFD